MLLMATSNERTKSQLAREIKYHCHRGDWLLLVEDHTTDPKTDPLTDRPLLSDSEDDEDLNIQEAFATFDLDQDGYLGYEELRKLLRGLGLKMNAEEMKEFIREGDRDRDGKIGYSDFAYIMKKQDPKEPRIHSSAVQDTVPTSVSLTESGSTHSGSSHSGSTHSGSSQSGSHLGVTSQYVKQARSLSNVEPKTQLQDEHKRQTNGRSGSLGS